MGSAGGNYSKDKNRCYVFPVVNPALTEGKHIPAKKNDEQIVTFVDVILGIAREKNPI